MLGIDFAVWLALSLSVGSAVLCVAYGIARWHLDEEAEPEPAGGAIGHLRGDGQEHAG